MPSVFWYVGGTDPEVYRAALAAGRVAQDVPTNHNPKFAPAVHPTLETGVQAMVVAALDALSTWPAPGATMGPAKGGRT